MRTVPPQAATPGIHDLSLRLWPAMSSVSPARVRLGTGVLVKVSSPPVPEPTAARALGKLVGEPVGFADRLDLRERPPGRTEHAEGMF